MNSHAVPDEADVATVLSGRRTLLELLFTPGRLDLDDERVMAAAWARTAEWSAAEAGAASTTSSEPVHDR